MLTKVSHIFEYLYLIVAALSVYKVVTEWGQEDAQPTLFIIFAIVGVFMFFFKRRFRKRMVERQNSEK